MIPFAAMRSPAAGLADDPCRRQRDCGRNGGWTISSLAKRSSSLARATTNAIVRSLTGGMARGGITLTL